MDKKEKLWKLNHSDGGEEYAFYCEGCKELHTFNVKTGPKTAEWRKKNGLNLVEWQFNGDKENPTFSPSLLYFGSKKDSGEINRPRCHLFLKNGQVEFLSDCEHNMAGKTVPLNFIPF